MYIDLNMVVSHPLKWKHGGYREIQEPRDRYTIIDLLGLTALCGFADLANFQRAHCQWVEQSLENGRGLRDDRWSESIAAGSLAFLEKVKSQLGVKALHREFEQLGGA